MTATSWLIWLVVASNIVDATAAIAVDYDDRDLRSDAPPAAIYRITPARIDTLQATLARLQLSAATAVADAAEPQAWWNGRPFERILLDAPCTGTGTLRRHPDGRWRLQPEDLTVLAALQDALLNGVAPVVAPGGLLVYSTCSLEPEENEEQVAAFLDEHRDFRMEPPAGLDLPDVGEDGCLRVLPEDSGFDGAFAARMRRGAMT